MSEPPPPKKKPGPSSLCRDPVPYEPTPQGQNARSPLGDSGGPERQRHAVRVGGRHRFHFRVPKVMAARPQSHPGLAPARRPDVIPRRRHYLQWPDHPLPSPGSPRQAESAERRGGGQRKGCERGERSRTVTRTGSGGQSTSTLGARRC